MNGSWGQGKVLRLLNLKKIKNQNNQRVIYKVKVDYNADNQHNLLLGLTTLLKKVVTRKKRIGCFRLLIGALSNLRKKRLPRLTQNNLTPLPQMIL